MKRCLRGPRGQRRRQERGLVTVVILVFILLVSLYVAANMRVLATLRSEVELIDRRHSISQPCDADPSP